MLRLFKCLLGPAFTALVFATLTSAQTPQPSQAATTQQPSQSGVATLHSGARLVVADVVVTDSHQAPVHNLKVSDFTVLDQNTAQKIKNFEEHTASSAADARLAPIPAMPPGIFTNLSLAPANRALNIILLDTLNTPLTSQAYVHEQLRKYLSQASPTNRIAIYGLNNHLVLLQGFTSDPKLLKAALDLKSVRASSQLNDAVNRGSTPPSDSDILIDSSRGVGGPGLEGAIAALRLFETQERSFNLNIRAEDTLTALNQIARSLAGVPGRKNLIWFSGSFPIAILPDISVVDPFFATVSYQDELRKTANLLASSQVVVYTVDARGVANTPVFNASNKIRSFNSENASAIALTGDEHLTMQEIADQSGGRAFLNTNDLADAVAKSIEDGSNYYTLAYSPTDPKSDGKFRQIVVKLQEHKYKLAYRRGYYADSVGTAQRPSLTNVSGASGGNTSSVVDAMHSAMLRGAPCSTQILMKIRVLPATNAPEDKTVAHNVLNPDIKITGPYRRYAIDYAADARDVLFTKSPEGTYQGALQFLTYLYDRDGNLVNVIEDKTHANLSAAAYADLLGHGIPWHQEISVPIKGDFYLRVGLHDLNSEHIGAVEVPVASVKDLTPIQATPASARADTTPAPPN